MEQINNISLGITLANDSDPLWILVCGVLVFFMQAGFLLLETGLVREKNSSNVAIKNLLDFVIGLNVFFILGFAIMFGTSYNGWFGTDLFLLLNFQSSKQAAFFFFQAAFMGTAATIISGSVAERMKFGGYLVVSVLTTGIIYPVFGHWSWGGGWLADLGFIDFAGSTVVHSIGGWIALAGAVVLGPRIDRYDLSGKKRDLQGHNLPLTVTGLFILWFGWFGFNGGSTLKFTSEVPVIILNTFLAASFGGMTSLAVSWRINGQSRIEDIVNGVLAGLVAVTAGCPWFDAGTSALLGMIAAVVVHLIVWIMENKLKIDDVVGAFAVHAGAGMTGTILIPVLGKNLPGAEGKTLFYLLYVQAAGIGIAMIWAFGTGYILFKILDKTVKIRTSPEDEKIGLNYSEHGARSSWSDLILSMAELSRGSGDLAHELPEEYGTGAGELAILFNRFKLTLSKIICSVKQSAGGVMESSEKFASDASALSHITLKQVASAQEAAAAMEHINQRMDSIISHVENQEIAINQTKNMAAEFRQGFLNLENKLGQNEKISSVLRSEFNEGRESLLIAGDYMKKTVEKTRTLEETVNLLHDIAERLQILSLNASIEAARSGHSGRGFAVVAKEITNLSEMTAENVKEAVKYLSGIRKEITGSSEQVGTVVNIISGMAGSFDKNAATITDITKETVKQKNILDMTYQAFEQLISLSEGISKAVIETKNIETIVFQSISSVKEDAEKLNIKTEEIASGSAVLKKLSGDLAGKFVFFQLPASLKCI